MGYRSVPHLVWGIILLLCPVVMAAGDPPPNGDGSDCSTLLLHSVPVSRQGLVLLARAAHMGPARKRDFKIRAYGGNHGGIYRIMILLGSRHPQPGNSSTVKELILRRFPYRTDAENLSLGYEGRLWSMLGDLTGLRDMEKEVFMARRLTANWRNNAQDQIILADVAWDEVEGMGDELERLRYKPIEIPGVDATVSVPEDEGGLQ